MTNVVRRARFFEQKNTGKNKLNDASGKRAVGLDSRLLGILACPVCGTNSFSEEGRSLVCSFCSKAYPVIGGIPDMRVFESDTYSSDFDKTQASYEAELHNAASQSYEERVVRIYGTKTRLLVQGWAELLDAMRNPLVPDYGCGTGQVSRVLASHVSRLFAFDISPVSVQVNVRENGVVGVAANAFFLPFKDMVFDLVCINGVLHHIVNLDRSITEIARVAKNIVCVSEGVPRVSPRVTTAFSYPQIGQRLLYSLYALLWTGNRFVARAQRCLARVLRAQLGRGHGPGGSKYERPLDAATVEALFLEKGFRRKRLQYFTNIDLPGDGLIKRMVTKVLVSPVAGTHFDLQMVRSS